jgi:hypothetical protein
MLTMTAAEYRALRRKPHKYGAARCACSQGHVHASRKEARDCDTIEALKKGGEYIDVKTQVRFPLFAMNAGEGRQGIKVCDHIVDKLVTRRDGTKEVIESKGFATAEWALKRKMFEANYPDIVYTVWRGK